jgi:hypothetical protein
MKARNSYFYTDNPLSDYFKLYLFRLPIIFSKYIMKFIYFICASALVFASACNNQPAPEKVTHTETIKVVEVEAPAAKVVVEEKRSEDKKTTEVSISPNSGSFKTKGLEIEVNK